MWLELTSIVWDKPSKSYKVGDPIHINFDNVITISKYSSNGGDGSVIHYAACDSDGASPMDLVSESPLDIRDLLRREKKG